MLKEFFAKTLREAEAISERELALNCDSLPPAPTRKPKAAYANLGRDARMVAVLSMRAYRRFTQMLDEHSTPGHECSDATCDGFVKRLYDAVNKYELMSALLQFLVNESRTEFRESYVLCRGGVLVPLDEFHDQTTDEAMPVAIVMHAPKSEQRTLH